MPIKISSEIRSSLPEDERVALDEYLLKESGNLCFLCQGSINVAADNLVADHDIPTAGKGPATRKNLKLSHASCNSFKRDQPTLDVRPFLRIRRIIEDMGGMVNYGDLHEPLGIDLGPALVVDKKKSVEFAFPDGTKTSAPVYEDRSRTRSFRYAYVTVPRKAIHNDTECQPRTIKLSQLWKIYLDIQQNPLHEPPSLRVITGKVADGGGKLVLFDGQHKTLACWLDGRPAVVAKVYLDLTTEETIRLVNSIQASIPKLPLSTFELTAKMDEETRFKLEKYLKEQDSSATEAGFLSWLSPADRSRGRQGFRLALVNGLLQSPDLRLVEYVQRAGTKKVAGDSRITETALKGKVLEKLLQRSPLTEPWSESEALRTREQTSIIRLLNLLVEAAFDIDPTDKVAAERRKRMLYQSSLAHIASILRRTAGMVLRTSGDGREFIEKEPTEDHWHEIGASVQQLVEHPIWTTDLSRTEKTRAVRDALSKNQDAEKAFRDVGLTPGYLLGDKLSSSWDS